MTPNERRAAARATAAVIRDDRVHALLALCARPVLPVELGSELARRAAAVEDWDAALSAAEQHALSPLLYTHLRAAQVGLAPLVSQRLQGLYVRHRRSNRIRLQALSEIVGALSDRGIDACVLKGTALMSLVYREPALRPASDVDLLVPLRRALDAQQLLRELGYSAPEGGTPSALGAHHHLPVTTRSIDGLLVQVEVHYDALSRDLPVSLQLDAGREAPVTFDLGGRRAWTLGPHEMLWHLCEHLVGPLPRPLRLISLADVVGWAAAFDGALDWERVRERYPIVLNVLALANQLSPLPGDLAARVPRARLDAFRISDVDSREWLWPSDSRRSDVRRWHQLRRSLQPPRWWAFLRYGTPSGTLRPAGRLRHAGVVCRVAVRRGLKHLPGGPNWSAD